jgi:transcriptional regulator with XRE-family HTH domain
MEAIAMILDASAAHLDPACWQRRTAGRRYGDDPSGVHLQRLRHAAGLSLHDVATALAISPDAVSQWEAGYSAPSRRHRTTLARLYRVAAVPLPIRVRERERGQQDASPSPLPPPAPPQIDGTRLRAARHAHGWTQTELADRTGVSAGAVSRWESQERAPSWEAWERLTAALGVGIEALSDHDAR